MTFKTEDIPKYNMLPDPEHFLMCYERYDKESDSDIWRFIELSLGDYPVSSDERCSIPRNDSKNRNKYILESLKNITISGSYICNRDGEFGIWEHDKRRYYSFVDQISKRDEVIEYLLNRINRIKS